MRLSFVGISQTLTPLIRVDALPHASYLMRQCLARLIHGVICRFIRKPITKSLHIRAA